MSDNMTNPIYQNSKHANLTDKYRLFSTNQVIEKFQDLGFIVAGSSVRKTRIKEKQGFQKHLVMFRSEELATLSRLDKNELIPEILFTNSHDGTCAGRFHLGLFRTFCANGLVVCDATFEDVRLRHSEKGLIELIPTVERLKVAATSLVDRVNKFKSIDLTPEKRRELALAIAKLRLPGADPSTFDLDRMLQPVRQEDKETDLFTVMNVLQEKAVRLGVNYKAEVKQRGTENLELRPRRSRLLTAIDASIDINKAIWQAAESLAA